MPDLEKDFIRWSPEMAQSFHHWIVAMPFGPVGALRLREEIFTAEKYETPEDQYEALCDLINGCRFSNSDYYVFCDGKLVTDF